MSSRKIAHLFGVGKSTIGDLLRKETYREFWQQYDKKPIASGEIHPKVNNRKVLSGNIFVFTSAQNNTYIHKGFLSALELYCESRDAKLIVGTFSYNKNGFQNGTKDEEWYDPAIRKYIINESCLVAKGLIYNGELNILPTAVNPCSGLHNYNNSDSGIIPHAKLQLESLPTPKHEPARMLYTTGAVTQRNYIQKKSGQQAEHHHVFSALVVEVDGDGDWFARQLVAESETGNFYDLDTYYQANGDIHRECNVEAINWGDIHVAKKDDVVFDISWGDRNDSVLSTLRPNTVLLHDVLDQQARNHHNVNDPYFLFKMHISGKGDVRKEVEDTANIIADMCDKVPNVVVVESNHDLALEKWLKEQDYRKDPINAEFFLEMQLDNYKAMRRGGKLEVFKTACHKVNSYTQEAIFLTTDESYLVCGDIECGAHGHNGNGGAKGSIRAYQMQGKRFNIGHSHSCGIKDGVYVAGVSGSLDMTYNTGGSSWSNSHIVTYKNGKRCIITIKDGKWRI